MKNNDKIDILSINDFGNSLKLKVKIIESFFTNESKKKTYIFEFNGIIRKYLISRKYIFQDEIVFMFDNNEILLDIEFSTPFIKKHKPNSFNKLMY